MANIQLDIACEQLKKTLNSQKASNQQRTVPKLLLKRDKRTVLCLK